MSHFRLKYTKFASWCLSVCPMSVCLFVRLCVRWSLTLNAQERDIEGVEMQMR